MNYKYEFEKISKDRTAVIIVFFKGFRKIVILPDVLRLRFTSGSFLSLEHEHIAFSSVGYDYKISKDLEISFDMKIRYSQVSAYLVFKSHYLERNEITNENEFQKARNAISDELDIVCNRLVE